MSRISRLKVMAAGAAVLTILGALTVAAQDRYSVQVPDGLAFAEFRGYENWEIISASEGNNVIAVILGNPAMIAAYKAGVPGNGGKFPDGAKMAKIHWTKAPNAEGLPGNMSDRLRDIDFMVKDSSRFAAGAGWGYAQFNYDTATDIFTPLGRGPSCGVACHKAAAHKDSVFSAYSRR